MYWDNSEHSDRQAQRPSLSSLISACYLLPILLSTFFLIAFFVFLHSPFHEPSLIFPPQLMFFCFSSALNSQAHHYTISIPALYNQPSRFKSVNSFIGVPNPLLHMTLQAVILQISWWLPPQHLEVSKHGYSNRCHGKESVFQYPESWKTCQKAELTVKSSKGYGNSSTCHLIEFL